MFKCPNCLREYNTDKVSWKICHAGHLHKGNCFFCERRDIKNRGLEMVLDFYLCKPCIDFIRNNTIEDIRYIYGQDVPEELKKKLKMGYMGYDHKSGFKLIYTDKESLSNLNKHDVINLHFIKDTR